MGCHEEFAGRQELGARNRFLLNHEVGSFKAAPDKHLQQLNFINSSPKLSFRNILGYFVLTFSEKVVSY
jgi:hypothetical protein